MCFGVLDAIGSTTFSAANSLQLNPYSHSLYIRLLPELVPGLTVDTDAYEPVVGSPV